MQKGNDLCVYNQVSFLMILHEFLLRVTNNFLVVVTFCANHIHVYDDQVVYFIKCDKFIISD